MVVLRPGLKQMTIYIPDEVYEALRAKAYVEHTSLNRLVTTAIDSFLRTSPAPRIIAQPPGGQRARRSARKKRPATS
jgi:hypothetical protein